MSSSEPKTLMARHLQLAFTCCCIAANALSAGGIFCFPLFAPVLGEHLRLSQPQLSSIVLAGMIGQYPLSVFVGTAVDRLGPWACSAAASLLFSIGFGMFSYEISKTTYVEPTSPQSPFLRLVLYFFMAGLGTVSSYFGTLFSASRLFPDYSGMAAGASLAFFGLSPLFLSTIATTFFTDPVAGLDVSKFVAFLAVFAGTIHFVSAFSLPGPVPPASSLSRPEQEDVETPADPTERSPLLATKPLFVSKVVVPPRQDFSVSALLRDPMFWLLAVTALFTIGSCEMVISNIGTIVMSLSPQGTLTPGALLATPASSVRAKHVRLISLSNTLARLLVGPLADYFSPVATAMPCGAIVFARKHHISRMSFVFFFSSLLAVTYAWQAGGVRTEKGLWVLSIVSGASYGSIFTVIPSITASIWGSANLGRNFGILSYAPFIGTPMFSYLYAFVAQHENQSGTGVCEGTHCWRLTFWVCACAATAAAASSTLLWKRWQGRV